MAAQKCHSVPAIFGGKLDNQTCELRRETTQIELVMNEAAPLMARVQVRGAHFKSYLRQAGSGRAFFTEDSH